ncbi:hypothetical protein M413DRAFT_345551 [Hebeloma cylindrosporum]|uniref:Uncharacterized protein n=1 Tax=Hebeloma cylindrosporum TaxID=76867 RepID=A0A0C2Y771_HEBCY|nr:hypothetical protein M413DRAFT_345551 [Hebeloma cylindrosporum h7]
MWEMACPLFDLFFQFFIWPVSAFKGSILTALLRSTFSRKAFMRDSFYVHSRGCVYFTEPPSFLDITYQAVRFCAFSCSTPSARSAHGTWIKYDFPGLELLIVSFSAITGLKLSFGGLGDFQRNMWICVAGSLSHTSHQSVFVGSFLVSPHTASLPNFFLTTFTSIFSGPFTRPEVQGWAVDHLFKCSSRV